MKHDAPEYIKVKFYTSCQSSSGAVKESNECDELKIGKEIEFRVEITVHSCPKNPSDWNQTFRIFPVGSQEAVLIHLEMSCDCSCEHQEHHVSGILLKSAMKLSAVLLYFIQVLQYMLIECKCIVL
jgi:hypothetical protein